jgi:hypothetical protein
VVTLMEQPLAEPMAGPMAENFGNDTAGSANATATGSAIDP